MTSAPKIACYCIQKSKEFSQPEASILIADLVLDKHGNPRSSNNLNQLKSPNNLGIYALTNAQDDYLHIVQGGGKNSTLLRDRIGQELRLYKKTKKGNNGGTLSKNSPFLLRTPHPLHCESIHEVIPHEL